ncbi:putative Phytocyanin domain, cupredoxin [Helianthus debilis subsp. tardiflorus]
MSTSHLTHLILLITAVATTVSATDHIVGANRGWNPGINYTLWANNHTFYVGDFICMYNVSSLYTLTSSLVKG